MAAADEAEGLPAALESWLALDYPDVEWIVVDDRSRDGTGALARAVGDREDRLTVVRVDALPEGWLGKVHALHVGLGVARGERVCFVDADVRIARTALRRAITVLEAEQLAHLTLIPTYEADGWLLGVTLAAGASMLLAAGRAPTQDRPGSRACVGVGAFNLVRRDVLERAGGLEALRLEVLDDMGVARRARDVGGRSRVYRADGEVAVRQYDDLGAFLRGFAKVAWAGASFRAGLLLMQSGGLAGLALGPALALAAGAPLVRTIGVAAWLALAGLALRRMQRREASFPRALALPLGQLVVAAAMLRALVVDGPRGSLAWRGTRYPFAALRAGRVVRVGRPPPA